MLKVYRKSAGSSKHTLVPLLSPMDQQLLNIPSCWYE